MERGIQYLRELAVQEMVYYDPDNAQLPTDPDEVQCTRTMWQKFVWSVPSSYANSLAVMDWKGKEAPTVDEVAGRLWQYKESLSPSSQLWRNCPGMSKNSKRICPAAHLYGPVSQLFRVSVPLLKREDVEGTHHETTCGFTCVTMERT
ncbi:hypothetical protein GRJ2_003206800 [Grus japonensis]|uniref:Uncharacterized protein n=1 Tax=Grus japonensis TaxID=30415 RepID=A0ABC9YEN6_GRUJA